MVFAGFTGVVLVGHFAVFTFITALLGGAAGAFPGQMSGVLLLFGTVSALAVLLVGRFGDRRPEVFLILAAGLVGATLLAAHRGGAHPAGAVVVVVLWGLSSGALPPLAQTMIMRLAGTRLPDRRRDHAGDVQPRHRGRRGRRERRGGGPGCGLADRPRRRRRADRHRRTCPRPPG